MDNPFARITAVASRRPLLTIALVALLSFAGISGREATIFETPTARKMNPINVQNPKGDPPRNGPEKMKQKKIEIKLAQQKQDPHFDPDEHVIVQDDVVDQLVLGSSGTSQSEVERDPRSSSMPLPLRSPSETPLSPARKHKSVSAMTFD